MKKIEKMIIELLEGWGEQIILREKITGVKVDAYEFIQVKIKQLTKILWTRNKN